MIVYMEKRRSGLVYRALSAFIAVSFIFCSVIPGPGFAQSIAMLNLPLPGAMVTISLPFVPVLLKGMTINPDDPLKFNFIVDSGNTDFDKAQVEEESQKLIKYFLASMTVPKDDLWVNLSPYENDRIIPEELGRTELGRDLLAQDYILKQLTASLMYPEDELGKEFWKRIYEKAQAQYGTTDIPVDTFNKVWILPEQATVYENGNTVYVVNSKMKVMLDSDYVAMTNDTRQEAKDETTMELGKQIIRELIIPEIEKEVNEGKNFAPLRQIYHSLILAKWYKETIKNSLLSEVYVDQNKTAGVELDDKAFKEEIYEQYMQAYKKGVFDFIREDYDELSQEVIPRKYYSGGFKDTSILTEKTSNKDAIRMSVVGNTFDVELGIKPQKNGEDVAVPPAVDTSMLSKDFLEKFDAIKASGTYSASVEINNHQEVLTIKDNTTDSSFSVVPGFGFKIHSLIVNGYTIYRPASDVIGSGGQVIMSPWVGRVENGQFDYNGKLQDINELESVKIDPSTGYPKDGLVRNQQWVLEDTGIDEEGAYIKASIDAADHPDILEHFGRSKLTMTIHISGEDIFYDVEVENLDNKKVYNAVGLHEYGISTNRFTTLELNAKSVLDADEKGIPSGGRIALDSPEQEHLNFNDGNIVAAGLVDRTYTDVETDDQGRWQAIVTDAERRIRRTYLVDGEMFQHPHIWSGNTGSYADITSVEFLTDAPNGINNPNSKAWLNVGEKRKGRIALHIETDVKVDSAMLGRREFLKASALAVAGLLVDPKSLLAQSQEKVSSDPTNELFDLVRGGSDDRQRAKILLDNGADGLKRIRGDQISIQDAYWHELRRSKDESWTLYELARIFGNDGVADEIFKANPIGVIYSEHNGKIIAGTIVSTIAGFVWWVMKKDGGYVLESNSQTSESDGITVHSGWSYDGPGEIVGIGSEVSGTQETPVYYVKGHYDKSDDVDSSMLGKAIPVALIGALQEAMVSAANGKVVDTAGDIGFVDQMMKMVMNNPEITIGAAVVSAAAVGIAYYFGRTRTLNDRIRTMNIDRQVKEVVLKNLEYLRLKFNENIAVEHTERSVQGQEWYISVVTESTRELFIGEKTLGEAGLIDHQEDNSDIINGFAYEYVTYTITRGLNEKKLIEFIESLTSQNVEEKINQLKSKDSSKLTEPDVGGIDMNDIEVERTGSGVEIQFAPDSFDPLLKMGIDGFVPVIINVTPVNNIMMLLGLEPKREEDDIELSKATIE